MWEMAKSGGGDQGWPWLLWALSLSMFAVGTTSLVVLGLGQEITTRFQISAGAAGWLMILFASVFAIAAPLAQWHLHGRWTYPTIVQAGLLLLAGGLFWASLANSFVSLLLSRGLAAFGGALIAPTSAALVISLVPDDRGSRGAIHYLCRAGLWYSRRRWQCGCRHWRRSTRRPPGHLT